MIKDEIKRVIANAERLNPTLNSFLSIDSDVALETAGALEVSPRQHPLGGIPIAIKDNICTKGLRTSCGSRILGNYKAQYDATAVKRLKDAGGVIIGKTNMDEFAMGSSNENSAFGPARNPWDIERVPGGSSGGSAVAVASGVVDVALGSETGGSVRQPASLCGIFGLKPTYGRISRYGLVAFASSLDAIGIFGSSAGSVADVIGVIAGRDPLDSTSADVPVPDYHSMLEHELKGKRIGVPRAFFGEGLDEEVRDSVETAIESFRGLGCEIIDIELPHAKYGIAVYYIIATAEASSNLARYDGVRYGYRAENATALREMYMKTREEGFGPEVKRRIMLGTYVLSSGYYDAYYSKAQKVRALVRDDYRAAFAGCDFVLTPTSPTTAFRLGERSDDPLAMYLSDIYTVSANLAGLPAISIPCGLSSERLPIGVQLIGNYWTEGDLLNAANIYSTNYPLSQKPMISAE
ncbi:Asp-tRNA(Asn)/Glu-tRNA(Gln) amidotransferase subunit GatA [Leptolyngbya sp. 7M]|uniref:Asp-tRNA(Asn)/Glu-tRNA(Gln) amidotransferase subunit GatA n=1 Tax=Leptolyngbya sp. 7M TaxID=2812896 RepID=UPI001B8CA70C|nr:Asp-tRNA(Asn)/Glu-tRNA(Gln) amidotransferase subunit GatA [Leptolyngbya sp. 7M]QYO66616.1 Asp-tRNA(Asn)/Glu-tRNA(Gln) amidotransferase subunit GatA [Leptolyngbya sp. 7M]